MAGLVRRVRQLRHAEVEQLHPFAPDRRLVRDDEDVRRLEIPVHDAGLVRRLQRRGDLAGDRQRARRRQRAVVVHHLAEGAPLQELHDEVVQAVVGLAEVGDVHDVRVPDLVDRPGLLEEARHELGVRAHVGVQDLDGHPLADGRMDAEVHRPHAAAGQRALHPVAADRSPFQD
jgi:hypothetical protein